jgi:hypothetical protein
MVSARPTSSARLLVPGLSIVGIGVLVALATDMAVVVLSPAKLAFILGGFALLIPTMVMEDPKAYWLFLLVLSIPFDISKYLSASLVDSLVLVAEYGQPASGTVAIEIYLTDVVLIAMLLPWLARVCVRRERLYFPKIGYIFVLYLAWALMGSLLNADSLYLSIFELCRQTLYLLFFMYLINNVATRPQLRSVAWAGLLGLIISAGSVIIFFERGVGTENSIFARLHDLPDTSSQGQAHKPAANSGNENLTLHGIEHRFGSRGAGSDIVRSQGMFKHPAIAAGMFGLTLPVVLAYLMAARNNRDRILFFVVFAWGLTALVLTFSRAGLIGLMVGTLVLFILTGWSGLISRRVLTLGAVALMGAAALSIPFLLYYFQARPGSFLARFYMFEAALQGYSQHPFLGVGFNNGTAAMKPARQDLRNIGIPVPPTESADSYYLAILSEVGPLGAILFIGFFGKIVMIGLRTMREAPADMKPLLVGMISGVAGLATQGIADEPTAGHAVSSMLWLFAALIVAITRYVLAETRSTSAGGRPEPVGLHFYGPHPLSGAPESY